MPAVRAEQTDRRAVIRAGCTVMYPRASAVRWCKRVVGSGLLLVAVNVMDILIQRLFGPHTIAIRRSCSHAHRYYYCWAEGAVGRWLAGFSSCPFGLGLGVLGFIHPLRAPRCMSALHSSSFSSSSTAFCIALYAVHPVDLRSYTVTIMTVTQPSPCPHGVLVTKGFCMWHLGGSLPLIFHRLPCFQNPRWRRCPRCVSDYAATESGHGNE